MIEFDVIHNEISLNGVLLGLAYSGHDAGLSKPEMEEIHNIGPIPAGEWRIVRWDEWHGDKGPVVAVLEPVGHDAHGRSGFLIHGDNNRLDFTASHGCIVANRKIRDKLQQSGETKLVVK